MAIVTVNLVDTFDEWRLKTNSLGSNTGDLATLATTDKSSIVAAINEIHTDDSDDMEHLLDDTTPQLGGNLDLNSKDITGTGDINVTGTLTATSIAGTVTGTTQSPSNNSTKLATTAYVDAQVATENTIAEMDDTTLASLAQGNILVYNATTSVWENKTTSAVGILSDLIDDTTPQLGGDLDLNSRDITGTGDINVTGSITATSFTGNILGSGSIAGTVTGVTQSPSNNSTKLATTAYVDAVGGGGGATESFAVGMAIALG